jgi:long-chain acyl-CoA synthetase
VRDNRLKQYRNDSTAIIVYTSGTTGNPKGVMISHRNLISYATCRGEPFFPYEDDLVYSFLPMAHVAERVISFYARIAYGNATAYASSMRAGTLSGRAVACATRNTHIQPSAVMSEVNQVRPTIFGSVPRVFEKAHNLIFSELAKIPCATTAFSFFLYFGRKYSTLKRAGKVCRCVTLNVKRCTSKVRTRFGCVL